MALRRIFAAALGIALAFSSVDALSAPPPVRAPSVAPPVPALPSQGRYVQMMQNPQHYLRDGALAGRVELVRGKDGAPLHWSGSFGTVFKGRTPTQNVAIRVFHPGGKPEGIREIEHRYTNLESYFAKLSKTNKMPTELLPVSYVKEGLHTGGQDLPLVKSPWIEGDELGDFVGKQIQGGSTASLEKLAKNWRGVLADLRGAGIAHGDLQHRNVKVEGDLGIRLIDYDAMFIPPLKGGVNSEIGHPNFEHPTYHFDANGNLRPKARPYDEKMDHFSSLVVYTSLVALSKHPGLWARFHNDDNLIFEGRRDFLHPETSPVFAELLGSPHVEVRQLATKLIAAAKGDPTKLGNLEDVLGSKEPAPEFATRVSLHGDVFTAQPASLGSQAVARPPRPTPALKAATGAPVQAGQAGQAGQAPVGGSLHAPLHGDGSGAVGTAFAPSVIPTIRGPLRAVSTASPGTLLFLSDGSSSMGSTFAHGVSKADAAATAINSTIVDFVQSANQGGVIRDRWKVGVISYGNGGSRDGLGSLRGAASLYSLSQIAHNPREVTHVADHEGQLVPSPVWVHPRAHGGTPMNGAFWTARSSLRGNGANLVLAVNVSDGASTDGDPLATARDLAHQVEAEGGQLLLTNIHITAHADPAKALVFPTPAEVQGLDSHAKMLFAMSSEVPAELAAKLGTKPGARMFAYNAAPAQLSDVLRAGSSIAGGVAR